jgi:hypothetical protein
VDQQVKEELSAIRDFLAGRSSEPHVLEPSDKATRQVVAAELLSRMSGTDAEASSSFPADVPSGDAEVTASADLQDDPEQQQPKGANKEEQERARKLFMDHGYFDEAVQDLRGATSPQQRVAAARALGVVGSKRGTTHLIAAMFDDDAEVRYAAEEALGQMSGPAVSSAPAHTSQYGERNLSTGTEASSSSQNATVGEPSQKTWAQDQSQGDILESSSEEEAVSQESTVLEQGANAPDGPQSSSASSSVNEFEVRVQQASQEIDRQESHPAAPVPTQETTQEQHETIGGATAAIDPEQLLLQEQAHRETVKQLERRLADAAAVRTELEKESILSVERETSLRAEAASRRREQEELRKRADEEVERRRSQDRKALAAEQAARGRAEAEARRIAEEEARIRLEISNLRKAAEELVWQRVAVESALREAAEAARRAEAKSSRDEAERRHNAELTRLHEEEEALRAATEKAALRRAEVENAHSDAKAETERLTKERMQLAAAEAIRHAEATRLRQEEKTRHEAEVARLRSEEEALRAVAEQVARRRAEVRGAHQDADAEIERLTKERAQLADAEASRRAETQRIREAEERNRADHERLRQELEGLRLVAQDVSTRRAEVEAARRKTDEDAARLLEVQARMRADEEASARAESERVQLEAEIQQRMKTQQRLLEEARRRSQEETERHEDEMRRFAEHEEKRRAELELLQKNAEIAAQQRVEEEKQIRSQVDSLRIADAEARKRIEEAEARRRKSEDVYRLVAEKVQRVEAEAHVRAVEEERILAKLEAVRRSAAIEAQARADQEKRIKEEIEHFRKLEEVERPQLEAAMLQKTEAQARFQHRKNHARSDEENRPRTEPPVDVMGPQVSAGEKSSDLDRLDTPDEREYAVAKTEPAELTDKDREQGEKSLEAGSASGVTAAVQTYLNSVDPYKRAAAVAELARSNATDAFDLIAKCFDDHSPQVRNAAARALLKLEPARTIDFFNRVLEGGSEPRRRNIGSALAESGLANEAIDNLVSENREATYNALSVLFVMAKTGEVQPLVQAIQEHPSGEVSEAAIKLLTLSGQSEIANAALKRRVNGSQ